MAVVEGLEQEQFAVHQLITGKRSAGAVDFLVIGQDVVRTDLITCFRVLCRAIWMLSFIEGLDCW